MARKLDNLYGNKYIFTIKMADSQQAGWQKCGLTENVRQLSVLCFGFCSGRRKVIGKKFITCTLTK
jgi:hypothetical protein